MTGLAYLLEMVRKASAGERALAFGALREYLRVMPEDVLEQEIRRLTNLDDVGRLLGAGLRGRLQDALRKRYYELKGGLQ
jgi:hypothetical protein